MEIVGELKTYEWGKLGLRSRVAQLGEKNNKAFKASDEKPFAELWMGDHPSGPSRIKGSDEMLSEVIAKNREQFIGGHESLPFLFKVLSVNKALSIQVHPSKEEAEDLHKKRPDLYKDSNHKPELAIALTPFKALCGFRPYSEIVQFLEEFPELEDIVGTDAKEKIELEREAGLKDCFRTLMLANDKDIKDCVNKLSKQFEQDETSYEISKLFKRLNTDFPNDVGVLSIFFLNIIDLEPGQAIYLPAKEIHAYLDGDCIECMACSDNVVRAGLTPKFKDVETLIEMLNYTAHPASDKIFKPKQHPDFDYIQMFIPSVKDFAVAQINVEPNRSKFEIENRQNGSILLVLSGEAEMKKTRGQIIPLAEGSIVFVPSEYGRKIEISFKSGSNAFIAYQAMYNDF